MPNDQKHALRYLLLRFLWNERNHVPPNTYMEVTKTLMVEKTHEGFLVKWNRNGHQFHKYYRKNDFKFFVRGDLANKDNRDHLDQGHNARLSLEFVRQALGLIQLRKEHKKEMFFSNTFLILFESTLCAIILFLVGGKEFVIPSILIFVLFTVELWPQKGKLFIPVLISVFIFLNLTYTAIISASIYSVLQYLDPDEEKRQVRIGLSIVVVGYSLFVILGNRTIPFCDIWIILVVIIVITAFLIKWTHSSHFRMFPLVFVFFCLGIYFDGLVAPAIAGLAYSLLSAFFSHLRFYLAQTKL